jgi:hypothetical protein
MTVPSLPLRPVLLLLAAGIGFAAEYPKAYTENGQVWIQTTASAAAFQATHDGSTIKGPALVSPNGNVIVYDVRESLGENRLSPLNIVFLDWSGKEIRRFREVPMKELGSTCGYGKLEWIDNDHVGVTCEFNPSAEDYLVLHAVSGKVEKEFPGLHFSWSPDHQTLAHVGFVIHFAPPAVKNNCLLFNDTPVYTPGCSNEVKETPKTPAPRANRKSEVKRAGNRTAARVEVHHYQNIHEISYPLLWSPNGRKLAFAETIYDFDWGMDDKGQETQETSNPRKFLAIVSTDRSAAGYSLNAQIGELQLEWLDDTHVKVREKPMGNTTAGRFERSYDLVTDPPEPIP